MGKLVELAPRRFGRAYELLRSAERMGNSVVAHGKRATELRRLAALYDIAVEVVDVDEW